MEQLLEESKNEKKENFIQSFLKNFSMLFVLRAVSILLLAGVAILGGRYLSVENFGKYNVINNLSTLLVIPIIFGMNSTLLKLLPSASKSDQSTILGTVLVCNIALAVIFSFIFLAVTPMGTSYFHLNVFQWIVLILLVILFNIILLAESILKSRQNFIALGISKICNAGLIFGLLSIEIVKYQQTSLNHLLIDLLIGQSVGALILIWNVGYIKLKFSLTEAKNMLRFNMVNMLSWFLTTFLINVDIYLLPYFVSDYDLGIYTAYELTTKNYFNIFFYDILAAVLIPMLISSHFKSKEIYKKVIKWMYIIFPVVTAGSVLVVMLDLTLYGSKYNIYLPYLIMTALGIGAYSLYLLLSSVLLMDGYKGSLVSFKVLLFSSPVFLGTMFLFTHFFGISGTMFGFFFDQMFLVFVLVFAVKKRFLSNETSISLEDCQKSA